MFEELLSRADRQPEKITWNGVNYYVLEVFFQSIALCARREDVDGGAAYVNTCIVPYVGILTTIPAPADAPAADSPPV